MLKTDFHRQRPPTGNGVAICPLNRLYCDDAVLSGRNVRDLGRPARHILRNGLFGGHARPHYGHANVADEIRIEGVFCYKGRGGQIDFDLTLGLAMTAEDEGGKNQIFGYLAQ